MLIQTPIQQQYQDKMERLARIKRREQRRVEIKLNFWHVLLLLVAGVAFAMHEVKPGAKAASGTANGTQQPVLIVKSTKKQRDGKHELANSKCNGCDWGTNVSNGKFTCLMDTVCVKSEWIPECQMIQKARGRDGKERGYIVALNRMDIEAMLFAADLPNVGIREGTWYMGYERIVKEHEYAQEGVSMKKTTQRGVVLLSIHLAACNTPYKADER